MSSKLSFGRVDGAAGYEAEHRSRRSNRRRLLVFLSVFGVLLLVGLVWDFARPAVYQATAQLDFVPVSGTVTAAPTEAAGTGRQYSMRDEIQYLTSRTLLARVWDTLKDRADTPAALRAGDPPATLQAMLAARQIPGTDIVAIEARGGAPAFLPQFVDQLIADYRATLDVRFKDGSITAIADEQADAQVLEKAIADKRAEVDAFRAKNDIVSLERDENQVVSEVKGTAASINAATDKVVAAEARLAALREAQAAGRTVIRARDNPTLASLEAQAASIRADLRAVARQFTPEYMKIDPRVRELRARQADIDEQITTIRRDSGRNAIQEAEEDVASARGAATALRQQLAATQHSVQSFTSNLSLYKTMQDQLTHLEQQRQMTLDRLSKLEASERARKPKVEVVEAPSVPQSASSPFYARDALLVLIGALVIGLLTMGIVEFFNRPPAQPSTVIVPQTWSSTPAAEAMTALPSTRSYATLPHSSSIADVTASLPAPQVLPRELDGAELTALLHASDPEFRAVMALLLTGLTAPEVIALRRGDIDRAAGVVRVVGTDERTVVLPHNVVAWLPANDDDPEAPLFATASGRPLTEATVGTALLYASHDAALDGADEVTPDALRHTYIASLLRQGMRFGELAKIVGPLPADRLSAYRQLANASTTSAATIDPILPALQAHVA